MKEPPKMEKQKPWQFYLILAVLLLTLYNILPTIFFYSKPLKSPINEKRAAGVAESISARVNSLEGESVAWLKSFSTLLGVKPSEIALNPNNPQLVDVTFKSRDDAKKFSRFLPYAGDRINFVPAQLELYSEPQGNTVTVARQVGVHFNPDEHGNLFNFSMKFDQNGEVTPVYRGIVYDRAEQLALGFAGPSKEALQLSAIAENSKDSAYDDLVISIAKEIVEVEKSLGAKNPIAKRYFASFTQLDAPQVAELPQKFITRMEELKTKITEQQNKGGQDEQSLYILKNQVRALESAIGIVKNNLNDFKAGKKPLTEAFVQGELVASAKKIDPRDQQQIINLQGRHPLVENIVIDWGNDQIVTKFYPEVQAVRDSEVKAESDAFRKEKVNQMLVNDIARVARLADETIVPVDDLFAVKLSTLTNSQSLMTVNLGTLASKMASQVTRQIETAWTPKQTDLVRENYPIRDFAAYQKQSVQDKKLGLVIYAPAMYEEAPPAGFRNNSIYVIARGLDPLRQRYLGNQNSEEAKQFIAEFGQLESLMRKNGFIVYQGSLYGMDPEFKNDIIFKLDNYYAPTLAATRENLSVKGSKRFAVLDFDDVEQRILTTNKIEDAIQEDLVKWNDEYNSAQVNIDPATRLMVAAPTKNLFWENLKLSMRKYFRGDERKILKWGLDLSGGKTVRIALRDQNNRPVTNPDDLKQAVNELYNRINKLGVAERSIRIDSSNIILDFPGSQGFSASDLIKASAMYFHIVNQKFTPENPNLASTVNQFLLNVWNEAVVTNRKDIDSINEIAWLQLGGEVGDEIQTSPRSDAAKILYDNGLRLANPKKSQSSSAFDDSLSKIAMYQGADHSEWENQASPLVIVFNNYALEGSNLTGVTVGYDAAKGNILNFSVKRTADGSNKSNPRDALYEWTSQFAETKIQGTAKEAYSRGHGWRMAVILNDRIISSPTLNDALKDGGSISGRFSQREINQLAADLKAGSLSFTPKILSEHNVSPELGKEERSKGIMASLVALVLVVVAMVGYYRFAGVVASCAVVLNLLIMWGVLQNLDAALTLPGIAAIVLTIGMAVDANVLVFERIREEFAITGRIASAIQAGYQKAFTAIVDSNITTIIAAIILIQFDSGPIKGFAVMLIIGIVSSMFTALFMTRYYFAGWVQNPNNKALPMSQWISNTKFDFIKQAKTAFILSGILMIIGGYFFVSQRNTMFGMDFTGGYSLTVEVEEQPSNPPYRVEAFEALVKNGATSKEVSVKELSKPNQLRIQLGMGMEEKGHPFYQMPESNTSGKITAEYEKNPRIVWVVNALQNQGLVIKKSQIDNLDNQWTAMGSQFSDAMRNNAIIALSLALLSILIYITIRFEFKYAIAAVIGLAHDIIITMGIFAIFHRLGFPVQIDLQVIGAIMTIIGYSLNDTIIIFDRIREDLRIMRKHSFKDVVNHALNVTLGRTLMTSGTTLLVLIALVLLGGPSIFDFSLVMTLGVLIGTLSSLFIASPVMLYFHNREAQREDSSFRRA